METRTNIMSYSLQRGEVMNIWKSLERAGMKLSLKDLKISITVIYLVIDLAVTLSSNKLENSLYF